MSERKNRRFKSKVNSTCLETSLEEGGSSLATTLLKIVATWLEKQEEGWLTGKGKSRKEKEETRRERMSG